ncbi:RNA polymerase sigma factor [Engelhardtia mirabilis]|uniref:ECF RNA polymerase sigma factor SigK n=1 Tax=Engelhardtia mirabilis TaxID=2528011 RepID=A0A518BF59_9BACT|nr:ECF RNA polymerase sigma factor SigK [Planctomycetes bacterium Pla133]QDU99940.1 ECF RNA polymerase sigma factor SigK [Planctomycetes bacterium Pla86]
MERVAAGEESAVSECLDRFGPLVWSLARRMTPNRDEAEDSVQEIFVDVWKSAARYDAAVGSETAFVATIARRRLIDRARRLGRRPQMTDLPEALPDEAPTAQEAIDLGDEAELARAELEQLRPEQKQVLRLAIWDGLSHSQIADHLSLPLGTVKTHVRRGLLKIRERIEAGRKAD